MSSAGLPDDPVFADTDTGENLPTHPDMSHLELGNDQYSTIFSQRWSVNDVASRTARCGSTSLQRKPAASWSSSSASPGAAPTLPKLNIPKFLGSLGELQRIEGSTESWQWVIGELKRCPRDLATRGEALFMHKNLYRDAMPRAIRAALGTSAAFCMLDEDRRQLLFRALDAEVLELLRTPALADPDDGRGQGGMGGINTSSSSSSSGMSLINELARLQALLLYQMMRMFGGGLEQRLVVEQQRDLLTTWALQLLSRSRAELAGDSARASDAGGGVGSWHSWIVAESIRRTVMIVFMFYGLYSLAMHGFCSELPTLAKLPVSTTPAPWHSEAAFLSRGRSGEAHQTLTYDEFTNYWVVSPPQRLDPFDKFLVVPCKGFEAIAS